MARQFGPYSPVVPLGVTWEEAFAYLDAHDQPIDLTDFHVRAQFYALQPVRVAGDPDPDPVFEITTPGYYQTAPEWPLLEAFSVPVGTDGRIELTVDAPDLWLAAPRNEKTKLRWSMTLVQDGTGYTVPFVAGSITFLPARTM